MTANPVKHAVETYLNVRKVGKISSASTLESIDNYWKAIPCTRDPNPMVMRQVSKNRQEEVRASTRPKARVRLEEAEGYEHDPSHLLQLTKQRKNRTDRTMFFDCAKASKEQDNFSDIW